MASRFKLSETAEAMCYLYTTVAFLIFAIVSFAIGSTYEGFVPVGITLLIFSVLFFILFLWRRKRRSGESGSCSLCCACCTSPTTDSKCDRCLAAMLCLQKPDPEQREAEVHARLSAMITPGDPYAQPVAESSRASRWPQLRSLQKVIVNLQREYHYLERYPDVIPQLEESCMSLLRQEAALNEWMSGRDTPTHDDIKAMKTTLSRIKRDIRQALTTAETNNYHQLSASAVPSISERVNIGSVVGPQPPPYTVHDPLDSSTSTIHTELSVHTLPTRQSMGYTSDRLSTTYSAPERQNIQNPEDGILYNPAVDHNAPQSSVSSQNRHNVPNSRDTCTGHNAPSHRASRQTPSHCYDGPYQAGPSPVSDFDGSPPADESDAPPSYEEAVSSTV